MPDLSPETMAMLRARGWVPPGPAQMPANPMPQPSPGSVPAPVAPLNADGSAYVPRGRDPTADQLAANVASRPPDAPPPAAPLAHAAALHDTAPMRPRKAEGAFDTPAGGAAAPTEQPLTIPQGHATGGGFRSTVSPGVRKELDEAGGAQAVGALRTGAEESRANDVAAKGLDEQADKLRTLALNTQLAERTRQDALTRQADEYKSMQDEAAKGQVNPERWYGEGGHSKALATVAMALGAFGSGLSHGRNPNWAADLINHRIEQDIDAQKENIASKHKSVDEAGSLYRMKLQQFGDERSAEMAAHATMLEQYKLTATAEATRAQSPIMVAKAKQLVADLSMEQAKLHAKIEQYVPPSVTGGLTEQQIQAEALHILHTGQENGKVIDPELARKTAIANLTGQKFATADYSKPPAGAKPGALGPMPKMPMSTNWEGQRAIQGTDAHKHVLGQDEYNSWVLMAAHARNKGDKTAAWTIDKGDTPETIKEKYSAAQRDLGDRVGQDAGGDANADVEPES